MTFRALVVALAATLALTACSSPDPGPDPDPADPAEGDAAELVETSPLTGLPFEGGRPDNPVFVVKIENTDNGAPQTGLSQADLVVEELVEGGLTRLAAMFYTRLPESVGHVRSLRGTDAQIARPVDGRVVATGGAFLSLRRLEEAQVPVIAEDAGASGFSRDPAKSAPYDRLVDLPALAAGVENVQPEQSLFTFADPEAPSALDESTTTATRASVRFSRSSTTQWQFAQGRWVRTNGHARDKFRAANLVVMFCPVRDAGYRDPAGNAVPETVCTGTGRAMLLRGGKAVDLTWSKERVRSAISLETADGAEFAVPPGETFVELVPQGDGDVQLGG